jgi:hypothetical protein
MEDFRLKIEDLRSARSGSILKEPGKKMTERSGFHKSSIFNSPINQDLRFALIGLSGLG